MAHIVDIPAPHSCSTELRRDIESKGHVPTRTIVKCSCGKYYIRKVSYRGEGYWDDTQPPAPL